MKICFSGLHPYWGGLENNGGSKTILCAVAVLRELGHDAYIATWKDNFTWWRHDPIRRQVDSDTDVVVAISFSDVSIIMKKYSGMKLVYWSRPFEIWQTSKPELKRVLRKFQKVGKIICNSSWQIRYLKKRGISAQLCYSGIDFSLWKDNNARNSKELVIGTLYSKKKSKNYSEAKAIFNLLDTLTSGRKRIKVIKLGVNPYKNLDNSGLLEIYNRCHIWLAPTKREGFHNIPAEAAMCGCLILASNRKKNGMTDYVTPETAMIYNDIKTACASILCMSPDYRRSPAMQNLLRTKIGSKKYNMERFVRLINDG